MDIKSLERQRGVGHVGVIVAVVVIAVVAGIGWWVWDKNRDDSGVDKTVQEALNNAQCDYDDKDLCKFFAGWQAQKYYTVNATSEADGQKTTTLMKIDGDGKTYLKLEGPINYEVITIGDTTYTRAADGTWWKQTVKNDTAEQYTNSAKVDLEEPEEGTAEASKVTYKSLGKEQCGNLTCFKYEVIDPDSSTTTYLWFDDKDYMLRRMMTTGGGTTYDATYEYSKVTVSEPSPVKELGANQYLLPGQSEPTTLPSTGDGPSEEELQQLMEQYQ